VPAYRIITTEKRQLVTTELPNRAALDAWVAEHGLAIVGEKRQRGSIPLAAEILGQPIIGGLHGPMWDGEGVVRYEDTDAYYLLSA
jgi:hypothetical protein